jgi:myo-inositol-1(or 4)-monophosphatase
VMMPAFQGLRPGEVEVKGRNDYVTWVDREAEAVIVQTIAAAFPDHRILAEEGGVEPGGEAECWWVIDPLDGTTNYIHGIHQFAVSLGLYVGGHPEFGLVYHPVLDELFWARRGEGAFLGERPLRVATHPTLGGALGATGFPFKRRDQVAPYCALFQEMLGQTKDLRRLCGLRTG